MSNSIEENLIHYIGSSLPLFSKQSNSYRFQCPYCQFSGKDSKGKSLAPSAARGYFYSINNAWNYKCHECGISQSFEKFIADQYPFLHFEYVRMRDQLGIAGYQTNCPSLEKLLSKYGITNSNPPVFLISNNAKPTNDPKVTKLPSMRSPQQQAGHQSQINHLLKIKAQQKRDREQWW